jgi:hypothetical protein
MVSSRGEQREAYCRQLVVYQPQALQQRGDLSLDLDCEMCRVAFDAKLVAFTGQLKAAIAACLGAPVNSMPRVLQDAKTIAEVDPEAGLIPIFWDAETQRVGREVIHRRGPEDKPATP